VKPTALALLNEARILAWESVGSAVRATAAAVLGLVTVGTATAVLLRRS